MNNNHRPNYNNNGGFDKVFDKDRYNGYDDNNRRNDKRGNPHRAKKNRNRNNKFDRFN